MVGAHHLAGLRGDDQLLESRLAGIGEGVQHHPVGGRQGDLPAVLGLRRHLDDGDIPIDLAGLLLAHPEP